jgi:hypothetical protein
MRVLARSGNRDCGGGGETVYARRLITALVCVSSLIDVFMPPAEQALNERSQLSGGSESSYIGSEAECHMAEVGCQCRLTVAQRESRATQGRR